MNETPASRPPTHFWAIAIIALLWNAVGLFDFLATQLRLDAYMSAFTDEQLAYFYGIPTWAVATWGIATCAAFFGSLAMLLRLRRACDLFVISLLALVATSIYSFVLSDGVEIMGSGGVIFSGMIVAIGVALIFYSRAMLRRGVLQR